MGWFAQFINVINTEYERRIKAASQINEYGEHHGHAAHAHADEPEEDAGTEITNVPPGTQVSRLPADKQNPQH
jgi:F420-0:gamma-glutamyl ligase-like protein